MFKMKKDKEIEKLYKKIKPFVIKNNILYNIKNFNSINDLK